MIRKAPNINHLWAALIVEELTRCGVTHFFIAPGSRSTPLVTAVVRNPRATSIVHFDERGTAFAALGFARASGRPAVWITTSGTALANGLPAIVEAYVDAVPLIALTADRPPELRKTGANQTINQPSIFGSYTQWAFDAPAPDKSIDPAFILTTIDQAVHRSSAGPVHLNWMFREPLAPSGDGSGYTDYLARLNHWETNNGPYTRYPAVLKTVGEDVADEVATILKEAVRGVVIAGRMATAKEGKAVQDLAKRLDWPLFADIGAQISGGNAEDTLVVHVDFLLDDPAFAEGADVLLQFGKRYTSKKLLNWVSESALKHQILIDPYPDRLDPLHNVSFKIEANIEQFSSELEQITARQSTEERAISSSRRRQWIDTWRRKDKEVSVGLAQYFQQEDALTEPLLARTLSQLLSEGQGLVVGNSMPVRDMDAFGLLDQTEIQVVLNRGASGIDGTVATAAGALLGMKKPTTLILGDLSLLHDLNSLALLNKLPFPLIVVVVNNDGGGIFSFLPISSYNDVFESHFAVPHGLDFKASAEMFGLRYEKPGNEASFRSAYERALQEKKSTLIEIETDRTKNLAIHRAIKEYLTIR
ncbi:MAG: 2-succinyl-5-enolpyruvyl-6-hydroxy-3-cyclohexene-1-carboxylic-acid synthase [Rhodothermales bacterium]